MKRLLAALSIVTVGGFWLLLLGQPNRANDARLWRPRNLGKALYENPTTQKDAVEQFRQALALAPGDASVTYNLATALLSQRRDSEAAALFAEIYAKHPDYLFGVLHQARERLAEGNLDEAARLIDSVKGRPRLHVTEFDALAITNIQLALVRPQIEAARDWLQLLEAVDPDDPNLDTLRSVVNAKGRG